MLLNFTENISRSFKYRKYKNILTDKENFYRTYTCLEICCIYHLILKKKEQ